MAGDAAGIRRHASDFLPTDEMTRPHFAHGKNPATYLSETVDFLIENTTDGVLFRLRSTHTKSMSPDRANAQRDFSLNSGQLDQLRCFCLTGVHLVNVETRRLSSVG